MYWLLVASLLHSMATGAGRTALQRCQPRPAQSLRLCPPTKLQAPQARQVFEEGLAAFLHALASCTQAGRAAGGGASTQA